MFQGDSPLQTISPLVKQCEHIVRMIYTACGSRKQKLSTSQAWKTWHALSSEIEREGGREGGRIGSDVWCSDCTNTAKVIL